MVQDQPQKLKKEKRKKKKEKRKAGRYLDTHFFREMTCFEMCLVFERE